MLLCFLWKVSHLPVEMLEMILIRAFMMLHSSDDGDAKDSRPFTFDDSRSAQCRVFTVLCSVCWSWWNTLRGWPQSTTPHWVKHQIKKLMERKCTWMHIHTCIIYYICRTLYMDLRPECLPVPTYLVFDELRVARQWFVACEESKRNSTTLWMCCEKIDR